MYAIKENVTYIEIIKKSKFITYLHPVTSDREARGIITNYKNKHNDATHVCYAYILDENTFKYYDDGEPTNSAGIPIYQVLKNNKLIYILCVVVRYFGGTKLGVGGLSHAYSNGAIEAIKKTNIIEYKKTNNYIIEIEYSLFDQINYFLNKKGIAITNKQFLDNIYLSFNSDENTISELQDSFPKIKITLSE